MATLILFLSIWIHVLSAITWLGCMIAELVILSLIKKEESFTNGHMLSAMSKNFARLYEIASGLLLITGIYQVYADNYLSVSGLVNTTFGNTVLLKIVLFFVFAGLGVVGGLKLAKLESNVSREELQNAFKQATNYFTLDVAIGVIIILLSIVLRFNGSITL